MKTRLLAIALFSQLYAMAQSDHILWYNKPATFFEESLVLGNGKMGASVFGGVQSDKIYLNDITLWTGEPIDPNMNPDAYTYIPAIREALKNEDYKLADSLNKNVQGKFSESYAPLGTMFINMKHEGDAINYHRELDLSTAVTKVSYEIDGIMYNREYFISYPDKVMVIKLSASKPKSLNFDITFESLLKFTVESDKKIFKAQGYAPTHAEPSYRGNNANDVTFDENKGTRFTSQFQIASTDGRVSASESRLSVSRASEAVIVVSVATSFNGFDKDPVVDGIDDKQIAKDQIAALNFRSYYELKKSHVTDYQGYFNRVSLSLGSTTAPDLPTNERLLRYAEGAEDKNLEVLYFQFGRYLLISSSRTPGVPANLQGLWNPYIRPPWSSNYTVNINLEENYWLAESANLSEMHAPLLSFIENLSKTGTVTAKTFYGVGGWAACHNSDIWAMSNPVGAFGQGDPVWANWNMGGTWLSTHLWEHYIFTKDTAFLTDKAYPLMKGAAQFCLAWLTDDGHGHLITSPSTSPENKYITPDNYVGATLYGGTADLAMIRECITQTIKAAHILKVDNDFQTSMEQALDKLYPYQVGKKGNLQEWYYDWEDVEPQHRHQSHLFGLYPGHQITPLTTPELAEACRKTLEIKGDETTGWSKGWRINLWARLWDGNHAYKMYRELLQFVPPDKMETDYKRGGGTYPNLFDAHPPFQIDGNFGGAAAVLEMLVQSTENEIRLLPALPDAWDKGSVFGVRTRGGFEVSMEWGSDKPTAIRISSHVGGRTTVILGDRHKDITVAPGGSVELKW